MEIICPKCNYKWDTKSNHVFVSCPSCMGKVRIKKEDDVNGESISN